MKRAKTASRRRPRHADTVPDTLERFPGLAGVTFGGKRDTFKSLGYRKRLQLDDYRARFLRNEVANRVIKAFPDATWRGGGEVWEDEDPNTVTEFEDQYDALNAKFKLWPLFKEADTLSRQGQYAIIVIGAPGTNPSEPLEDGSLTFDDIAYFQSYAQIDAPVQRYNADSKDPRYGLPEFYTVTRNLVTARGQQSGTGSSTRTTGVAVPVHWSRVLHVAEGRLGDLVFGEPALRCIWNRLDDLEKVVGGGAEAFWKRADQGMQIDMDPNLKVSTDELSALQKQVDDYINGLKRVLRTRGIKMNPLGSDVANFDAQVRSIIGLISAGTGIPQRILMGSEQAKLASEQDGDNWDDRIDVRREEYCDPMIVHPFIDWMVRLGVLPEVEAYETKWNLAKKGNPSEAMSIAKDMATINQQNGEVVYTNDEIRQVTGHAPQEETGAVEDDETKPEPTKDDVIAAEQLLDELEQHARGAGDTKLAEAILALAARPISVTVNAPNKKIMRDKDGRATGIANEE